VNIFLRSSLKKIKRIRWSCRTRPKTARVIWPPRRPRVVRVPVHGRVAMQNVLRSRRRLRKRIAKKERSLKRLIVNRVSILCVSSDAERTVRNTSTETSSRCNEKNDLSNWDVIQYVVQWIIYTYINWKKKKKTSRFLSVP